MVGCSGGERRRRRGGGKGKGKEEGRGRGRGRRREEIEGQKRTHSGGANAMPQSTMGTGCAANRGGEEKREERRRERREKRERARNLPAETDRHRHQTSGIRHQTSDRDSPDENRSIAMAARTAHMPPCSRIRVRIIYSFTLSRCNSSSVHHLSSIISHPSIIFHPSIIPHPSIHPESQSLLRHASSNDNTRTDISSNQIIAECGRV